MGNSGLAQYAAKLEEWAAASDEGLRAAARWALGRLRKDDAGTESLVNSRRLSRGLCVCTAQHGSGLSNYP